MFNAKDHIKISNNSISKHTFSINTVISIFYTSVNAAASLAMTWPQTHFPPLATSFNKLQLHWLLFSSALSTLNLFPFNQHNEQGARVLYPLSIKEENWTETGLARICRDRSIIIKWGPLLLMGKLPFRKSSLYCIYSTCSIYRILHLVVAIDWLFDFHINS